MGEWMEGREELLKFTQNSKGYQYLNPNTYIISSYLVIIFEQNKEGYIQFTSNHKCQISKCSSKALKYLRICMYLNTVFEK